MGTVESSTSIAVIYLARGADAAAGLLFRRFLDSYCKYPSGIDHKLYVIFKGFSGEEALKTARHEFKAVPHEAVFLGDDSLDIGAYIEWARDAREQFFCPLNTATEIICENWLLKLYRNLQLPGVGLVGATGSFESLNGYLARYFPPFPNVHIRSTGFMTRMETFRAVCRDMEIRDKITAFLFESGPSGLTRQVLESGQRVLLVGRNGRGYSPRWWPTSGTFRQSTQQNLLIADNQTRSFAEFPWLNKRDAVLRTWGHYIDGKGSDLT